MVFEEVSLFQEGCVIHRTWLMMVAQWRFIQAHPCSLVVIVPTAKRELCGTQKHPKTVIWNRDVQMRSVFTNNVGANEHCQKP